MPRIPDPTNDVTQAWAGTLGRTDVTAGTCACHYLSPARDGTLCCVGEDGRPEWARRIRAERVARGWSQADAVRAMQAHAGKPLSRESELRSWKRWEAGSVEPD